MFNLEKGCLTLDNYDLDHLSDEIESGYNPKEALKNELEMVGIDITKVNDIMLKGNQLANIRYVETYAKIICEIWDNK